MWGKGQAIRFRKREAGSVTVTKWPTGELWPISTCLVTFYFCAYGPGLCPPLHPLPSHCLSQLLPLSGPNLPPSAGLLPQTTEAACLPTVTGETHGSLAAESVVCRDFPSSESHRPCLSDANMCHVSHSNISRVGICVTVDVVSWWQDINERRILNQCNLKIWSSTTFANNQLGYWRNLRQH